MVAEKDITPVLLEATTLPRFIEGARRKCGSHPLVKTCNIEVTQVLGSKTGDDTYDIRLIGHVAVESRVLVKLKLDLEGTGQLEGPSRRLTLKNVKILNDFEGLLTAVAGLLGVREGRSFTLDQNGVDRIRAALA